MFIVIDTNSVNGDLRLKGPAIKKLINKATEQGYKMCFPEVVVAEMEKHFHERIEVALRGLRKSAKTLDELLGVNALDERSVKKWESLREKYPKTIKSTIAKFGGLILKEPTISKKEVMLKAVNRKKPFQDSGKGLQDTLIWASILDLSKRYAERPSIIEPRIIFVTANHTDFCKSVALDLHDDLVEELENINVAPVVVKIVKSLDDASSMLLSHVDDIKYKETMAFLTGESFKNSELIVELEGKIQEKLPFTQLSNDDIGLSDSFEDPTVDMIHEDYVFQNVNVEPLSNGEIAVTINVSLTCLLDVFVTKYDAMHLEEYEGLSIYDHDWNNHYVAGQIERNIWFKASFITDNLRDISSFEIEPDETMNCLES
ncbi:PIN domain-containing protein [Chitinophaga niabensis]|uniref:DUF4935 domain-containing protein n=1 Tax=Chitinophaga niabensis TaxID=536979 RepID=A0A1N6KCE2_9BACT|nr:PIN domain-containing protein [Chitinophaga niabensis]SIO53996.1 protein of unknown function [Chitinophaga niabensis]